MDSIYIYVDIGGKQYVYKGGSIDHDVENRIIHVHDVVRVRRDLPNPILVSRLKKWMQKSGLNQKQMAEVFGVSQSTVSKWLRMKHVLSEEMAAFISVLGRDDLD